MRAPTIRNLLIIAATALQVTAQEGETFVTAANGAVWTCPTYTTAEVYYSDKCPSRTTDGIELDGVTTRVNYPNNRVEPGDYDAYTVTLFCRYGSARCRYRQSSTTGSPYLAFLFGSSTCPPAPPNFGYNQPGKTPPAAPSGVSGKHDRFDPPPFTFPFISDFAPIRNFRYRLSTLDVAKGTGTVEYDSDGFLGYRAVLSPEVGCFYNKLGASSPEYGQAPYCPNRLCPSRYDPNLTRRRLPAAIDSRQVNATELRDGSKRQVEGENRERGFRFWRREGGEDESELDGDEVDGGDGDEAVDDDDDLLEAFEF